MIPKTMFFYWGGEKLSYLRYLSIYSFHKFNPGWRIRLYVPTSLSKEIRWSTKEQSGEYTGRDYMPFKRFTPIPFDFTTIGVSNDLPEVYKSDLLRYHLLSTYGGFYSDIDITYFKPLKIPKNYDTIVCYHHNYFSIGLMGGCKGNLFYKEMLKLGKRDLDKKRNYQGVGNKLFKGLTLSNLKPIYPELKIYNIPMNLVYPMLCDYPSKIFNDNKSYKFPEDTIGLHWFAGSPLSRQWENTIKPSNFFKYDNILGNALKRFKNG